MQKSARKPAGKDAGQFFRPGSRCACSSREPGRECRIQECADPVQRLKSGQRTVARESQTCRSLVATRRTRGVDNVRNNRVSTRRATSRVTPASVACRRFRLPGHRPIDRRHKHCRNADAAPWATTTKPAESFHSAPSPESDSRHSLHRATAIHEVISRGPGLSRRSLSGRALKDRRQATSQPPVRPRDERLLPESYGSQK